MILADFALNLAAGLTQWLFEPQLDDWRRRISDPQRNAVKKVIERAADQMLRQVQSDLQRQRPDLGPADYEALGQVLSDFFALPQVANAVLEAAILNRPLDGERMQTHLRTVHGPERLTGIPFELNDCLPRFLDRLGAEMQRAAQDMESPLHNFWSVLVAADTQAAAGQTLSEVQDIRLLLQQTLVRVQPDFLWVNVPPKPSAPLLGRDDLIADLLARLSAGHSPALSTDGLPGVGKTALAVVLAHDARVRDALPDGVLWGGLGVNPDVVTVQNQWAAALGVDLADEPAVHRRAERLSRVLGDRRVLVVIDDAWTIEAAQALRLSSPQVVHLLTTRDRTIARAFAGAGQQVHVPELAAVPAYELLARLAHEACAADPDAARALVQAVGELPLAIEVLGGYLAGHELTVFPDLAPEAFAALGDARQRLALATERLGGQTGKKESLEAVIRLSVDALPVEAAAAFWALGAFAPKPATFDRAAAQAVTQAEAGTLALLVGRNLVETADGVLAVHQVVHDVMAGAVPGEVVERHREYYLDVVDADDEDWRRIETVYEQVRFAADAGNKMRFVDALETYQTRRGIWGDRLAWLAAALAEARGAGDRNAEARKLNEYGFVYSALGDKRQALDFYEQALPLFRQVGDKRGEATTLNNIGTVYDDLGDKRQALDYYEQALPLRRQVGDKGGEATTLNNIGLVYSALGEKRQALDYYEQVLPLFRQVGDKRGEATTLNNIGRVYDALGDKRQALDYYEQALPLRRQVGDKRDEATTLNNIGGVYDDLGEKRQALGYLERVMHFGT
ncbi:MAG: tetratricopeptide repeat protein [Caldilinea sp.]|nr:tetratricopeptide repeat protein [Caldilinea sp.]